MSKSLRIAALATVSLIAVVAVSVAAAKVGALSGSITADGSSTVGPYTQSAAELFQRNNRNVRITVGISGTGGGFERFCRNEIDLANASRPIRNNAGEAQRCAGNGVKYVAFTVANDALTVVVNRNATWVKCLSVADLKKIWEPGSKVDNWNDVRPSFPDVPLKLFGAGTDSGTFDYFTEAINGRARASRSDYQATEDDNVTVQGVSGERGALGYFGFSYFDENRDKLKALQIVNPKTGRCVAPGIETTHNNTYKPLSRPLFVYAKVASFQRAEVRSFIGYIFNNQKAIAQRADFIWLTPAQARKAKNQYQRALKQ
jgi:phosphate transport system substrate-binding protein